MRCNCLVMALFMWLKHGYTVFYVKPYTKDGLPHFVWWNHHIGSYQHYTFEAKQKPRWWNLIWFKGYIDNFPFEKEKLRLIKIL